MSLFKSILQCTRTEIGGLVKGFKTSSPTSIDIRWRIQKGLSKNPNRFGPLTNLPDYSYKDGRPTPYGVNQKRKILKNREYAAKIVKLVGQIDYAVEKHQESLKEKEEERQRILSSKLKPKGDLLLEQKKDS